MTCNEVILIIPNVFSTGDIRESIKNMHMTLPVKPPSQAQRLQATQQAKRDSQWSAEKQMEHELTRNRMKELMKRRRKANAHSSATPDSGSICGSFAQSPAESDPGTPQEFAPPPPKPVKDNSSGRESIMKSGEAIKLLFLKLFLNCSVSSFKID